MTLRELIAALPKAELHIHLEGSLEPELLFQLASRNGVETGYDSVDSLRAAYVFSNLQEFLDIYYVGMRVLRTEDDFYDLATAYFRRARADNVRHAEVFFDPQAHTGRGIAVETVVKGIARAADDAGQLGVTTRLIPCFLRHLPADDAVAILAALTPFSDAFAAVGLDSSELGHPPGEFSRAFDAAHSLGLRRVAHAGEEGPPAYVREALDVLNADRIDHGNRAMEDPALIDRIRRERIPLTVCPLSNLKLGVVERLTDHPLGAMLDAGLVATVNSDDPAYFGGYLNDNFVAVAEALSLSNDEVVQLAENSFAASFLEPAEIDNWVDEVRAVGAAAAHVSARAD